jgi:hypothetical protein
MTPPPQLPSPADLTPPPIGLPRLQLFLADMGRVARLALGLCIGQLVVTVGALAMVIYLLQRPMLFVVLDPEGNVIPVPGAPFPEARELHVMEAMLATTALLSRNPRDFDQPEFLQGMLSAKAFAEAKKMREADAREFNERQIHQKPQIARIDAIANHRDQVQVQVNGEVSRWGFLQQAPFTDSIPFTLRLSLRHNPDLLRRRQRPLVIESFTLQYENTKP